MTKNKLNFTQANIVMARTGSGRFLVWDTDVDAFGSGETFAGALSELSRDYPKDYKGKK